MIVRTSGDLFAGLNGWGTLRAAPAAELSFSSAGPSLEGRIRHCELLAEKNVRPKLLCSQKQKGGRIELNDAQSNCPPPIGSQRIRCNAYGSGEKRGLLHF
jgi:hypothetical protein